MTIHPLIKPVLFGLSAPFAALSLAAQQPACPATRGGEMPLKYQGGATVAEITACDLMTRLYIYSDDSMMGRKVGTADNIRATAYIENEVRKLGLKPAGDNGGYFQYIGLYSSRSLDSISTIAVDGRTFHAGTDFTANILTENKTLRNLPVVYGGVANDTTNLLPADAVRGHVLVLSPAPAAAGGGGGGRGRGAAQASAAQLAYRALVARAAMVVTIVGDQIPASTAGGNGRGGGGGGRGGGTYIEFRSDTMPGTAQATNALAVALFGKPLDQVKKGETGKPASFAIKFDEVQNPARNVVAVLPGSDPKLRNEYVLISAHNDHIGFTQRPVDHDSLKIYNHYFRTQGADDRPTPAQMAERLANPVTIAAFKASMDSVRKLRPIARMDSIYNGADDDGSGTVTVLEIAEKFAKSPVKPKRSIVFIWQTGEESGMWGSAWFAAHPTVPRDSIVADINMDMVGRGAATDATGSVVVPDSTGRLVANGAVLHGGPGYLQLVGSRRLSKEFGDVVESVNKEQKLGFNFDYAIDANGHPQNIYCRSDHASYAKYGIPVVFMTTGGHADYHQLTDEAQYIDYKHMAEVGQLAWGVATRVGNLDHRVKVDVAGPFDPTARCQQ